MVHPEGVPLADRAIDRDAIAATELAIRPYIRRTPVLECGTRDVLPSLEAPLVLKLELLQHAGSFKARGAFANLLLRDVPAAGGENLRADHLIVEQGPAHS
jgi:threonine dehydratase